MQGIVRIYETIQTPTHLLVVMERMHGRLNDLFTLVRNSDKEDNNKLMYSLLAQLATTLYYFNTLGFVHNDLKPENILYRETSPGIYEFKICDFGASTLTMTLKTQKSLRTQTSEF